MQFQGAGLSEAKTHSWYENNIKPRIQFQAYVLYFSLKFPIFENRGLGIMVLTLGVMILNLLLRRLS